MLHISSALIHEMSRLPDLAYFFRLGETQRRARDLQAASLAGWEQSMPGARWSWKRDRIFPDRKFGLAKSSRCGGA